MKRIETNEKRLDNLNKVVLDLDIALSKFEESIPDLSKLNKYYESKEWLKDKDDYENCAFSFYGNESSKQYNANISLKDYTYNYKKLKNKIGENRKMFLGHMLENGAVKRGFACGINNENVFCIEGTRDGSKYEDNARILRSVFGDDNCKEDDYYIFCKDDIFAGTNRDGTANVGVSSDNIECMVISNGTMNCS